MKTSHFIDSLVADAVPHAPSLISRFWVALGLAAVASVILFAIGIGPRADFVAATHTLRFDFKFVETLAPACPTALLCSRLMRPDAHAGTLGLFLPLPFLLLGLAGVSELLLVSPSLWEKKMIGVNSLKCLTLIPLLSIGPLAAMICAMRGGASRCPALSGAFAGAAAAGLAATLYASNCTDDSPLFVATWYPLATFVIVGVGAVSGRCLLRW
jgi:hypothetical protein